MQRFPHLWGFVGPIALAGCLATAATPSSSGISPDAAKHWTADNGNGTYSNPLFYEEFEDPDVIRVGDTYYLAGTTMHMNPAVQLMHSKDLVNWELAGYCTDRLDLGPAFRLEDGRGIYGRGIWAPCIRYHNGMFYVFSNVNGAGLQVFRSRSIKGPWERNQLPGRHDLSVLFDDDGKIYIISGARSPYPIEELAPDLKSFVPDIRHQLDGRMGEGHHLYKIKGKYYDISAIPGGTVDQMVARADSIDGPWTVERMVQGESLGVPTVAPARVTERDRGLTLHQGGMCDTLSGEWWSIIMSDHGSAGRMVALVPITWDNGFPLIGLPGNLRKAPNTWIKPNTGFTQDPKPAFVHDDNFDNGKLNPLWQWNHVPDDTKWSLSEKPRVLRLHSLPADNFYAARNSICQRPPAPESLMTVELDTSGMVAGDTAGLALLSAPYAWIGVVKSAEGTTLQMLDNTGSGGRRGAPASPPKPPTIGPAHPPQHLWLRVHCNFDTDQAIFSWSTDGREFTPLGSPFTMTFQLTTFQGVRPSLFHYNTSGQPGGYVDFDNYTVDEPRARGIEREIPLGKTVVLTSGADGSFLVADTQNNTLVNVAADPNKPAAQNIKFQVVDLGKGRVALKAANGRFVSADGEKVSWKDLAGKAPSDAESFQWVNLMRGDTMLMSLTNHRYLATQPDNPGPVTVSATGPRPDRKDGACFKWQEASGFPKPADLPQQASLPDLLVMLDGRKVTSREMWVNERRPELIRLFQHYMYGQLPPKPAVSAQVERVDAAAFSGKATLSEVTLTFGPPGTPPIHLMLVVPNRRATPAPVVLALNYFGNHTLVHDKNVRLPDNWMPEWGGAGAWSAKVVGNRATEAGRGSWAQFWPIEDLLDRGYALATFYNGDIDPDTPNQRGLQRFFPQPDPADDCGTIGAWAWGLQRAVDYLVTAPGIDPQRIVVTGHSRTGKAALLAAAFDPRIALAIPHQAGCGGSAPSRARIAIGARYNTLDTPQTKPPETVANINDKFPHWFNARFKEFNAQPERLPFDQHCLVALCAPRPVLFTNGRADTWINPAGQSEVLRAAAPVYRLLGAGDFAAERPPPDGQMMDGTLGYYLRPGGHSLLREDWMVFLDFADKHLGSPASDQRAARSDEKAILPGGSDRSPGSPITIDPDHPHSFRQQSGPRFFPMGDTAYYLIAQPADVIAHYIDVRRAHKFNFIRMMAMADGFWPFGGTPGKPQYTVIDETAMRKWDWVFDYAAARSMNIELIIWGYGVAGGEGLWASRANQDFWIRTLVQRFRHRPNLFMYTIANEFERYPDGQYQYDPADVEWAQGVAARIRELDPIHPVGCHPSVWITDQDLPNQGPRPFATYKGFTQHPPQVVWPLWEGSAVNLNVTQNNEGVQPRTWGNFDGPRRGLTYYSTSYQGADYPVKWTTTGWDFEAAGLEDCLAEDWAHGQPVLNTEFGYQHEPGYEAEMAHATRQCHQPATVRKKAWKIATAGAYFAAGFEGTAVRNFTEHDADNFRPYQLEVLYDFFTGRTQYWKMSPHPELVAAHNVLLALPGREYIAYFPRGGTNAVKLVAGTYQAQWLHPETGRYYPQPDLTVTDGNRQFVPPERPNDDWVLHLRHRRT